MAKYVNLPPIRRLIKPDQGHLLCDCDLSGADAQVVAWEADDASLKHAFRTGVDIHDYNGRDIYGEAYQSDKVRRKLSWRDEMKRLAHGTNYLSGSRGMAKILGWPEAEIRTFQDRWFLRHPGIEEWHRRVEDGVSKQRTVRNAFGYRIVYFDRPTNVLPKAVAWGPQSTVAIVTRRGCYNLYKNLPWVQLLLQVHDSVVFQIAYEHVRPSSFADIRRHLEVTIPYRDPLTIPWGLRVSKTSWGELGPKQSWEDVKC